MATGATTQAQPPTATEPDILYPHSHIITRTHATFSFWSRRKQAGFDASVKKINIKINTYTHKHMTRNSARAGRGHTHTRRDTGAKRSPSCPHGSLSKLSTTHNSHTLILYSTFTRYIAHTHASHSQAHLANPGNDFTFFLSFTLKNDSCVCV